MKNYHSSRSLTCRLTAALLSILIAKTAAAQTSQPCQVTLLTASTADSREKGANTGSIVLRFRNNSKRKIETYLSCPGFFDSNRIDNADKSAQHWICKARKYDRQSIFSTVSYSWLDRHNNTRLKGEYEIGGLGLLELEAGHQKQLLIPITTPKKPGLYKLIVHFNNDVSPFPRTVI